MREIKFRGKRIDNGEWVYGYYVVSSVYNHDDVFVRWIHEIINTEGQRFEIQTETVGQYTGLKDKNGNEVYEGDVVKFKEGEQGKEDSFYERRSVVYGLRGGFEIAGKPAQDYYTCEDGVIIRNYMWHSPRHFTTPEMYFEIKEVEVIGNIHDNPELLEE